ncbi:ParB/Srx family N-terminal domain-containing protein [Mesorhizobium sp. CC13]|uniref:ParB/Srx family N-terminal domain-containing protein n=1 Tax=Mesorhizobium sp. CC13 TaxID=3029194 RepID=UPI003263DE7A
MISEKSIRGLEVEYLQTSSLTPDPNNARKHSQRQITRLKAVIAEFGFTVPILVDERLIVIAGHARLMAAKELHLETVPCIRIEGLSEVNKIALALADNKLSDMSEFDPTALAKQLETLCALDVDFKFELTGFETAEIDLLLKQPQVGTADAADDLPDDEGAPVVSRPGDLWQLGIHRVICGDARDPSVYSTLLGKERANAVFCDSPYNVAIDGHVSGLG